MIHLKKLACVGLLSLGLTSLSFAAEVESTPAPGRGVVPSVSDHYKAMPSLYDFNQMPVEQITESIGRQFIIGTQTIMIRWELKAGALLPLHFHANEQITSVEKGSLEVYSQGRRYVVKPGQTMVFPPNVPHEFIALEDVVIVEVQTPARQDYINGEFDKMKDAIFGKK